MIIRTSFFFLLIIEFLVGSPPSTEPQRVWINGWDVIPYSTEFVQDVLPSEKMKKVRSFVQSDPPIRMALNGGHDLALSPSDKELNVTIIKQDLNASYGPDTLDVTLTDDFNQVITTLRIQDDGQQTSSYQAGPIQTETLSLTLSSPGIYHLALRTGSDLRYDVIPHAAALAVQGHIELLDSSQLLNLFFLPKQETMEFQFSASYAGSTHQTVSLYDSGDQLVAQHTIENFNGRNILRASVPPEEREKIWRLHIENQDLDIRSPQVEYWFPVKDQVLDLEAINSILQPRQLEMAAIPGSSAPFRFILDNTFSKSLTIEPQLISSASPSFPVKELPNSILISSASKEYLFFQIQVPMSAESGQAVTYTLTLHDQEGLFLGRAEAALTIRDFPPSPSGFLFTSPKQLEDIRRQGTEGDDYLRQINDSLIQHGDNLVEENLQVPEREAGYTGLYICDGIGDGNDDPNDGDGAPLIFDPLRPGEYFCSIDGRRYRGDKYEEGWYGHYHYELASRLRSLGIAYALEPKIEYAALVREMLLDFADRYKSWPFDDYEQGQSSWSARLMTETLGEAIWLVHALIAYDFTRFDAVYSPADHAHIEQNLIRPIVAIIQGNPEGTSNWQAWHDTAVGFAGYVLNDSELVDWAVNGPEGFHFLKENAIRDDGLWLEGSTGYHFFALTPLELLMETMEAHNVPAFDEKIQLAHQAVLSLLYPDGTFPKLNDSFAQAIERRDYIYEHAHAHYDEPVFSEVLTEIYDDLGYKRNTMESLFFGREYERGVLQISPSLNDKMGLSILRSGDRLQDLAAIMDYGPHGLGHGHFDKLHVSLYGQGFEWLPDLGIGQANTAEFGGWFRQSLGHNTVILGEQNQKIDSEKERPIDLYSSSLDSFQVMKATIGQPVYSQGSSVQRTVITVDDDYAVLIDEVSTDQDSIDFVFHSAGDFFSEYPFEATGGDADWEQSQNGYNFLKTPRLYNDARVADILKYHSAEMVRIESRKPFGFQDGFENVDDWNGNVNLSSEATEGQFSLSWVIVPRRYQTISKEFELLSEEEIIPDRLTFDIKIEAATFSQLILQLIAVPEYPDARWEIARGETVQTGEWQHVELDLTQPDQVGGSDLRARRLQFTLFGAEKAEIPFLIFIDNLQVFRSGEPVPSETRGVQLIFPGGEPTDYYLANGPSPNPPRIHPVILARRTNTPQTRHVTIIEPFLTESRILESEFDNEDTLGIRHADGYDEISLNLMNHSFQLIRRRIDDTIRQISIIGGNSFQTAEVKYHSNNTIDFSLSVLENSLDLKSYRLEKQGETEDELTIQTEMAPNIVLLDGEEIASYEFINKNEGGEIVIDNLPQGDHVLEIRLDILTPVQHWQIR